MTRLLVHVHPDQVGGHYHHADGYAAPTAVIAAAMTLSALVAVRAITTAHPRPVRAGGTAHVGRRMTLASTAGFLGLEAVDAALIGPHPGQSGLSVVLAAVLHGLAGFAAAAFGRACVRLVVNCPCRPVLRPVEVPALQGAPVPRRVSLLFTQHLCVPIGGRAPPVSA